MSTSEQELTAKLKAALNAHRADVLDGKCGETRISEAVKKRHQAVAEASSALYSWRAANGADDSAA